MKLEKVTRWYDDACGTAHALELVGERWALLITRELMFGPRRFGELKAALNGISANVLTQRLAGLEAAHILVRRKLPPPANVQVYELTPWGYEADVILQVMGRWAARSPDHDPTLPLSPASLMMSFRTMFDAARAGSIDAVVGFRFDDEHFRAQLSRNGIVVTRGPVEDAEVTFTARTPMILAAAVYGGAPLHTLEADGSLAIDGDRALAEHFVTLFPLPSKVST